ncbi:MAG: phosphate ABC transporter substrate-binding protein [Clostridiales bacterium]|nr:phosphate ABC transporter substrate-binding protein [Clostridiales bacterium]
MVVGIFLLRYNDIAKNEKGEMKMKKIFVFVLAFVFAIGTFGVLAACDGAKFDESKSITVVTRGGDSGTKSAFMEIIGLKGKADVSGSIQPQDTAAVLQEVKSNPLAIGYDSLGYVTDDVKILKVDGVEATVENIKSGTYKISRPLSVVYQESNVASDVNSAFLTFLQSLDAQTIVSDNGYVSTKDGAVAYTVVPGLSGKIDISGSTSLLPLMEKLAAKFEQMQSGISVTVAGGGSGTGYNNAQNGVSDFGMISEVFNLSKAEDCISYEVAKDGIAVIVNKANTFDNISLEDLRNIYDVDAGEAAIKVWADVSK